MGLERLLENTPEAYYWMGFLMSDGHFDFVNKRIKLTISIKDETHMQKFCNFISHSYRHKMSSFSEKSLVQKSTQCVEVSTKTKGDAVKKFFDELVYKFNLNHKKTYDPPKINIIDDDLFVSFFAGLIDGDGSIYRKRLKDCVLEICCHGVWENNLNQLFSRTWDIIGVLAINKNIKVPSCKRFIRGENTDTCRIRTCNTEFIWKLKQKCIELSLPILARKWDKVVTQNSNTPNACAKRNEIISAFNNGDSLSAIHRNTGVNLSWIHEILHNNKDLWCDERLKQFKQFGKIPHLSKFGKLRA